MTSKLALLASAAAVAAGAVPAFAEPATTPIPEAASYADLLEPVPDAMQRLQVHDELVASTPALTQVQYWRDGYGRGYDHHHHHHHWRDRGWYRSHGYYWNGGGWVFRRPNYYHHHHHHHHHHDWR